MNAWLWWVIIAAIFTLGELLTFGLMLAPFAIAAGLTAAVSALGLGDVISLLVFVVASVVCIVGLRPVARRHRRPPARARTGTAALVGGSAVVTERIVQGAGNVKLAGETWTARAYQEGQMIDVGTQVQVIDIDGATALVSE